MKLYIDGLFYKGAGIGRYYESLIKEFAKRGMKIFTCVSEKFRYDFEKRVLEEIYNFMEDNPDVGLIMPKVLYPDGSIQYLCELLPTPLDLFGRRFLNFGPFKKFIKKRNEIYELRFTGYDKIMEVPYLSGCFMFLRTKVLK